MPPHPPPALDDPELAARAMLARKRRFLLTVLGNVLMLAVLVGGPYVRGILRARATWPRFAQASVCLFGGKTRPDPGLGVPRGHEERFAAQVLGGPAGFPKRCDPVLEKLAPEPAILLLPWLKTAEYELGQAVRLLREELHKLPLGADTRISTRPLRAFELVRAALSRQALAAGVGEPPQDLAFAFDPATTLSPPTRVPLFVGGDAVLTLWGDDRRFEALGIDSTGLSYLSMEAGTLWPLRLPRPKLLSAFLPDSKGGVFVWAMSQARCRERSDGCAGKTLGLGRVRFPPTELPEPRWFASQPAGRVDRSLLELGDGWLVAAAAGDGETELREFAALENTEGSVAKDLPPLAARSHYPDKVRGQVVLTRLNGAPLVLNAASENGQTALSRIAPQLMSGVPTPELQVGGPRPLRSHPSPEGGKSVISSVPGGSRAWLVTCASNEGVGFAFGHDRALRFGELRASGEVRLWDELALDVQAAVHDSDPARDHVLRLCHTQGPSGLVLTPTGKLLAVTCSGQGGACSMLPIAQQVRGFAGLVIPAGVLVAYAGSGEHAHVRVQRLDGHGKMLGPALTPAACWADARGMCGVPLLARLGARIVLGAREGTDLLALESPDEGTTWEPLRGIRKQE